MTRLEFDSAINCLINRFGARYYPEEILKIFFMKFSMVSHDDFRRVCNRLLVSSRFAPLYQEFESALSTYLIHDREKTKQEVEAIKCDYCGGSGVLTHTKEFSQADYASKCTCKAGELFASGLPFIGVYANSNLRAKNKQKVEEERLELIKKAGVSP